MRIPNWYFLTMAFVIAAMCGWFLFGPLTRLAHPGYTVADVRYYKDVRVGLCYAAFPLSASIVVVPCTPDVERLATQ